MSEDLTLVEKRQPVETGLAGATPSLGSLAPEIYAAAYKRLAWLGLFYSVGYFLAFFSALLLEAQLFRWSSVKDFSLLVPMASILAGLVFAYFVHTRRIPAGSLVTWALVFEVVGALGIAGGTWGWEQQVPVNHRPEMVGIPWGCVWILICPAAVAVPPGKSLVAGLLAASMLPSLMWLSPRVHGVPPGVELRFLDQLTISLNVPAYICAGLASAVSAVVYGLSREVTRARRMGSYQLVERIGSGGMGEVWRARHRLLVRPAAIKLIHAEAAGTNAESRTAALKRFEREAQATALLRSPHTVELYDFGVTEDGTFYYVMELLEGLDLKTLVERFGPLPAERAVHILRQVCHSLADAHENGLIHRDIKPANVIVGRRGLDPDFVKVLDFGLVTSLRAFRAEPIQLTQQGMTPGTPAFMAPELALAGTSTDARVDLYALGCVAYWLVTGQLVFVGPTPTSILVQHAKDPPPPPSKRTEMELHPAVDEVILSCLRKDPRERPASARELDRRLDECSRQIPPWTEERAAEWWRVHAPAAAAPRLIPAGASA